MALDFQTGRHVAFGFVVALATSAALGEKTSLSGERSEESVNSEPLVETFVLTPIHTHVTGYPVPADVLGPTINNSCQDKEGIAQSCYLPAHVFSKDAPPTMPWIESLLEAHLSAVLDTWNVGAWPSDGASIVYDLKQYHSLTHLWLSMRIGIRQELGCTWLTGTGDPVAEVKTAASRPAASIDVEVFGSTRGAEGYPHRKGL